jgi:hypothetical protein
LIAGCAGGEDGEDLARDVAFEASDDLGLGQPFVGRLCAGSYEVTPPDRSRAYGTTQQADKSNERQQNRI